MVRGKEHEPVDLLAAGDIGGVAKLSGTATGDTLAPKGQPVHVAPIEQPAPVLATAVVAKTQADDDKLASALHRLQDEDPALVVDRDEETHQTVLRGTGETHLAITLERLERKFGVNLTTEEVKVRYRETIMQAADAEGRHKKQSGGHGQFAVATIRLEPLERGEGFEFVDKIVGGAVSRAYIPAVAKGIEEAMGRGGVNGYPVVDVRATLVDGKEHSVDSSEMAFRAAGRLAFREAMGKAEPVVLEPIARLDVTVPNDLLGDVMGDLNSRRGKVQGTEPGDTGEQVVYALAPQSELLRYAVDLRSLTGGRGRFSIAHDHYDVLPEPPRRPCPARPPRRGLSMATRPPSDAVVALRSLGRRWGALFAGLGEDESVDALAHRPGADGRSALDHAVRATRTLSLLGRAVDQALVDDDAVLHPAVGDPAQRVWDEQAAADVDDAIAELAHEAQRLADRIEHVPAGEWQRRARVAGQDADVGALEVVWDAVDSALADLKAAEATLREVRGRP